MNQRVHEEALLKLHWAEQNIRRIETEVEQLFLNLSPSLILRENNLDAGTVTFSVQYLPPVPSTTRLLAGDVLRSFRYAFRTKPKVKWCRTGLAADKQTRNHPLPQLH